MDRANSDGFWNLRQILGDGRDVFVWDTAGEACYESVCIKTTAQIRVLISHFRVRLKIEDLTQFYEKTSMLPGGKGNK